MVSHFVYILLERLLWIAAMGIGQFIYNYQTLITGVLAVGAAYMASRPVYRQVELMQIQSNGVRRELLLQRQLEIEQACVAVKEKVGKALSDLSREFDCYAEEDLEFRLKACQARNHDLSISRAASWLEMRCKWRDNVEAETRKASLIEALEKLTGFLKDFHYPADQEQHDEHNSISDSNWTDFLAKSEAAKTEIEPALIGAKTMLKNFQDSLVQELNNVITQLKKLERSLISAD